VSEWFGIGAGFPFEWPYGFEIEEILSCGIVGMKESGIAVVDQFEIMSQKIHRLAARKIPPNIRICKCPPELSYFRSVMIP
jgi:hypothetical protein